MMFSACHQDGSGALNKKEQSLWINLRKDPVSLEPRRCNDRLASQLHFILFESLVRLNADMTFYTFFLRDTLWSDGTPVTAYDFEKAWKSMLDPKFPAPDAYLLNGIKMRN